MAASLDTTAAVRRLLHRTGFAAGPDEVAAAARAGFGTTLERVLHPDPAASQATPPTFPALTKPKKSDTAAKKDYRTRSPPRAPSWCCGGWTGWSAAAGRLGGAAHAALARALGHLASEGQVGRRDAGPERDASAGSAAATSARWPAPWSRTRP